MASVGLFVNLVDRLMANSTYNVLCLFIVCCLYVLAIDPTLHVQRLEGVLNILGGGVA